MDLESRDKQKKHGFRRLMSSFKYSWEGLVYAYRYEQSMSIHLLITTLVILAGVFFKITYTEWILCLFMVGVIVATELINTSIEAVVDLACPVQHPLAKVAKDTASAAVFAYAVVAFITGTMVFLPHIITFIQKSL